MKKVLVLLAAAGLIGSSAYFAWTWQQALRENAVLRDRIAQLDAGNKNVEEAIARLRDREKDAESFRSLSAKSQKYLKASYVRALMQSEKLLRENATLKARLDETAKLKITYAKDLQAARNRIEARESEIAAFKGRLADLQASTKRLEADNAKILENLQKAERTVRTVPEHPLVMPIDFGSPKDEEKISKAFDLPGKTRSASKQKNAVAASTEEEKKFAREAAITHYNLGVMYMHHSEYKKAAEEFERSIAIDAYDPLSHYNLAVIYDAHRSDPKKAIAHYETYLRLLPNAEDLKKVQYRIFQMRLQEEKGIGFDLSKQK